MVEEFGPEVRDPVQMHMPEPVAEGDLIHGEILHIDRFGNLITNLLNESLHEGMAFEIAGRRISRQCRAYADAPDEEPFAIRGSTGFVEICVNRASAAEALGAAVGTKFSVAQSE
jgi:S-adenosyl-L-methionine hydrolase (adenosine-forming)